MSEPQVVIDGHYLSALMPWGDLEWVTCWPGGTQSITFSVSRSHRLFRPDAIVEVMWDGQCLALGALVQTSASEPLMAEGLQRKGEDFPALNSLANGIEPTVHTAVVNAISRGLPWVVPSDNVAPEPGINGIPALDIVQPHSVAQYLDASARERGIQWGIDPASRQPIMRGWDTTPSLHMLPGVSGLGISRDGFASALYAPFLDEADGTYRIVASVDEAAIARWGRVEHTVAAPLAEGAAIPAGRAVEIIDGIMAQGRSQIGWTKPLEVRYGDVVNDRLAPVELNSIFARKTLRLHGLEENFGDLAGRAWVDMPIARTTHKGDSVTIEPRGLSSPMSDALAGLSG